MSFIQGVFVPYQVYNGKIPAGRTITKRHVGRGLPADFDYAQDAYDYFLALHRQAFQMSLNIIGGYGVNVDSSDPTNPVVGLKVTGDLAQYDIPFLGATYVNSSTAGSLQTASGFNYNPGTSNLTAPNITATTFINSGTTLSGGNLTLDTANTIKIGTIVTTPFTELTTSQIRGCASGSGQTQYTLASQSGNIDTNGTITAAVGNIIATVGVVRAPGVSTNTVSTNNIDSALGSISSLTTSYMNALGTSFNPGSFSTFGASISSLSAQQGTISSFTTSYINALVPLGFPPGSISTNNASISSLNVNNMSTNIGTISSFNTSYINALGPLGLTPGSISTNNASVSTLNTREGTISSFTTSYMNALGTAFALGSISTNNASVSTLNTREGTISSFTTSYMNALGTGVALGSISTNNASVSTLNTREGTISSFTTSYMNALGTSLALGSISTNNASVSTLNARVGTISSFTTSYMNALGTGVALGSISTNNASVSTLNTREGTISSFTTSYMNALGTALAPGSMSTVGASISSLTVSSVNGTPMPSTFYFNSTFGAVGTPNPGLAPTYTTNCSSNITVVNGQKYSIVGHVDVLSAVGTNESLMVQLTLGGALQGISTAKTNSGSSHQQQIFFQQLGTFTSGGVVSVGLGVATSALNTNYTVKQGQYTLTTPIP